MKELPAFARLFIFLLVVLLPSCAEFKDIEIGEIQAVHLKHLSYGKLGLDVVLSIKNPNKVDFFLVKSDVRVILNDIPVGTLSNIKKIKIPGGSQSSVTFPVNLKMNGILSNVLALLSMTSGRDVHVKMEGHIKAKVYLFARTIPIEEEVSLKIR